MSPTHTPRADSTSPSVLPAIVIISVLAAFAQVLPNANSPVQGKWQLLEETGVYVKHVDADMRITYNRDGKVSVSIRCDTPLRDRFEVFEFQFVAESQSTDAVATATKGCLTGTPTQTAIQPWKKHFKDLPKDVHMKR